MQTAHRLAFSAQIILLHASIVSKEAIVGETTI